MKKGGNIPIRIVFIIFVLILIYNHFLFNPFAEPAEIHTQLNDLQKESLEHLKEMTKLLISLSIALFGLTGYFVIETFKARGTFDYNLRMDLILGLSLAALSIDFGYILMDKWVEMLVLGLFEPYDKVLRFPQLLQLITFLLSLFFCGKLIYKILFKTINNSNK